MRDIDESAELQRLRREIDTLPMEQRAPLLELYEETVRRRDRIARAGETTRAALGEVTANLLRIEKSFAWLDDALADLQLNAELLLFDLEARRRERRGASTPPPDDAPGSRSSS